MINFFWFCFCQKQRRNFPFNFARYEKLEISELFFSLGTEWEIKREKDKRINVYVYSFYIRDNEAKSIDCCCSSAYADYNDDFLFVNFLRFACETSLSKAILMREEEFNSSNDLLVETNNHLIN
jgi:hypothetical protein